MSQNRSGSDKSNREAQDLPDRRRSGQRGIAMPDNSMVRENGMRDESDISFGHMTTDASRRFLFPLQNGHLAAFYRMTGETLSFVIGGRRRFAGISCGL